MIQKSGAFLLVAEALCRQLGVRLRSAPVQEKGFDLYVDSVKVRHHLVVDSEAAVCGSCPSLVSLIDSRD